jgi:hypothetical protein
MATLRRRAAHRRASLGVQYVAYSYSAFAAGRQPKAISVISGTGLILPGAVTDALPASPIALGGEGGPRPPAAGPRRG